MFDYDGFDPVEEQGLLRTIDVYTLKAKLEEIIDRMYETDIKPDFEEIHCCIKRMGDILGVYVPACGITYFDQISVEDIETKLLTYENLTPIYKYFRINEAINHLLISQSYLREVGLSNEDIARFCNSDLFKKRCMEVRDVL